MAANRETVTILDGRTVEVTLPNKLGYERIAMECSASFAKMFGLKKERIEDLKTAVSEACLNAIEHGNKGRPEARVVIFHAHDGYTTSFPLDYIMDNDIIMACKMNGVVLPPERGFPFQLVAESKWGYKWIKWIDRIELSDDVDYEGFWESRGYSNTGDLDKDFFGE